VVVGEVKRAISLSLTATTTFLSFGLVEDDFHWCSEASEPGLLANAAAALISASRPGPSRSIREPDRTCIGTREGSHVNADREKRAGGTNKALGKIFLCSGAVRLSKVLQVETVEKNL
jgi:hypothetical protein